MESIISPEFGGSMGSSPAGDNGSGGPSSPAPESTTINTIRGRVEEKGTGLGVPRLLVVVVDVDPNERSDRDLVATRLSAGTYASQMVTQVRLGSVLTGPDGAFELTFEDADYRLQHPDEQRPDLMLLVTGPEDASADTAQSRILAVTSVRQNAGRMEQYLIRLTGEQLTTAGIPLPTTPIDAVESTDQLVDRMVAGGVRENTIIDGLRLVGKGRAERVRNLANVFHNDLKPQIRQRLSRVPQELVGSPSFVAEGESVVAKSTALIKANIEQIINSGDPKVRPPVRGYVALTARQAREVASALRDGVISAELLERIINTDGAIDGVAGVARPHTFLLREDPLARFGMAKSERQKDLETVLGLAAGGGLDGDPSAMLAGPSPSTTPITQQDILSYSGRLMSTMTSPEERLVVDLEPQANHESVGESVRNLTFAPSPADVPAFYDFHNLQIAFEHVWQEVIDEGVVDLSEDAFHQIVELGGDLANSANGTNGVVKDPFHLLQREGRIVYSAQKVVRDHRNGGSGNPADAPGGVVVTSTGGPGRGSGWPGNVRDHRTGSACNALADDPEDDPLKRVPQVLSDLEKRLKEDYAFTIYAANRKERSVNFGILITYQQKWEPLGYQAGRLAKTITLAPRETIRYSKKTVSRRKRSAREVENHLRSRREETSSTTRSERDIVRKATSSTNFSLTTQDTVEAPADIGGPSSTVTTSFQQSASKASEDTKKAFHEAVFKAAQEYKDENTTEVNTEESVEVETTESGEITNPNDELALTCLFYQLERRHRVTEQIRKATPVVFVAQEVPRPDEIDEAWLLTYDWVLRRVLLDDSFLPALNYLCQNVVGDEIALGELRRNVLQQRCVVDNLQRELGVVRDRLSSYRQLLERSLLHRANRGGGGGGGFLSGVPVVGGIADGAADAVEGFADAVGDLLFGGASGATAQDSLKDSMDRIADEERDLLFRLEREVTALNDITEKYAKALAEHFNHKTNIDRLRTHVKQNILYYMQAIWSHEPPDQRFFRLHKTPVPILEAAEKTFRFAPQMRPATRALAALASRRLETVGNTVATDLYPVEVVTTVNSQLKFAPLVEVADLDSFLGFKGNYMIFSLKQSNALTDYMMHPYIVEGLNDLVDPDDTGNWTLEDFAKYVVHLKETLSPQEFEQIRAQLTEQYQQILANPRPNGDEITISTDSLFIELMPSAHSSIENYKRESRKLDVKKQQAEVRRMELESVRYAARLLAGEHEDPEIERKIVVEGTQSVIVDPE